TGVPHHGLLGIAGDLRTRALGLEVKVTAGEGGELAVALVVRNNNAGHAVPAGLPERRVLVRVVLRDKAGTELGRQERALGRVLVDDKGVEVPFWQAARVAGDTRIAVGSAWTDTVTLPAASAGTIDVDVVYRGMPDAIATQLAIA